MSIQVICARLQQEMGMSITQTEDPNLVIIESEDAVINMSEDSGGYKFKVLLFSKDERIILKIKEILHGYEINPN